MLEWTSKTNDEQLVKFYFRLNYFSKNLMQMKDRNALRIAPYQHRLGDNSFKFIKFPNVFGGASFWIRLHGSGSWWETVKYQPKTTYLVWCPRLIWNGTIERVYSKKLHNCIQNVEENWKEHGGFLYKVSGNIRENWGLLSSLDHYHHHRYYQISFLAFQIFSNFDKIINENPQNGHQCFTFKMPFIFIQGNETSCPCPLF